jgi:hypothetical protein
MQSDFDLADIPVEFLPFFEPEGPAVVVPAVVPPGSVAAQGSVGKVFLPLSRCAGRDGFQVH